MPRGEPALPGQALQSVGFSWNLLRCSLLPCITDYKFQNHLDKLEAIEMCNRGLVE